MTNSVIGDLCTVEFHILADIERESCTSSRVRSPFTRALPHYYPLSSGISPIPTSAPPPANQLNFQCS
eukprot:IDg7664t1